MGDDRRQPDEMMADPGTQSPTGAAQSADRQAPPTRATPQLNPQAMSAAALAQLLSAAGGVAIEAEKVKADVDAGAPTNPDGTINLVHYAAWLVKEAARANA